jgi:hypothetical protein
MEFKPKCEVVEESVAFVAVEVLAIHYDVTSTDRLTVHLGSSSHGNFALVFSSPEAVRVLDEGQICEFWNTYSNPNGWLWRVTEGGWLALESTRDGFWLTDVTPTELCEYMVVGDQCVFVLTRNPPTFEFDTDAGPAA